MKRDGGGSLRFQGQLSTCLQLSPPPFLPSVPPSLPPSLAHSLLGVCLSDLPAILDHEDDGVWVRGARVLPRRFEGQERNQDKLGGRRTGDGLCSFQGCFLLTIGDLTPPLHSTPLPHPETPSYSRIPLSSAWPGPEGMGCPWSEEVSAF